MAQPITAKPMRAKQPRQIFVDGADRLLTCYRRPNQPVHLLYGLDFCLDNAHPMFTIPLPAVSLYWSTFYNTVVLVGLFSGGQDPEPPPPLIKYAMPPAIHVSAANSQDAAGYLKSVDYGQDGTARTYSEPASSRPELFGGLTPASPTSSRENQATPQIVVNVQAIDSRSFLDHSGDIAQAVREAMLNMHALNDVVSEL